MPPKKPKKPEGQICDLTEKRGVKIYYEWDGPQRAEWQGDQERVLFLLLGSAADLRKTTDRQYINLTSQHFKVLAYDHRNTGQTTISDEPCTMQDYADDAAALLEAVIPDQLPVLVLGVSFGGMVAQHLAIRHPHLVKKLVLACCATGGQGGMSYPIHEWYADGVTVEERVEKKMFQANIERNAEWKEKNPTAAQMAFALLNRDEKVGTDNPLYLKGVMRQLDARKGHDTWEQVSQLEMPVLCVGSDRDNITPPALTKALAERIGSNAETKLDFPGGHAFIAAEESAMPWVNDWLRRPVGGQVWKVVGGADKGGILVRAGAETSSEQAAERLSTDALVRELAVAGERLNYQLLQGTGPATGWVSIRLKDKELLVKTDEVPAASGR